MYNCRYCKDNSAPIPILIMTRFTKRSYPRANGCHDKISWVTPQTGPSRSFGWGMRLQVTVIPQHNTTVPPEMLPCPTHGHSPHYSVGPSHNTIPTYGMLPPVTQTNTTHKAVLTLAKWFGNQSQERTALQAIYLTNIYGYLSIQISISTFHA
jgi:hypothetical protein